MSPAELRLPRDPEAVDQAAEALHAQLGDDRDRAWRGARGWATQAARDRSQGDQQHLAEDVLRAYDRLAGASAPEPEPQPQPAPAERAPERPAAPAPVDPELAARLDALAQRAEQAEATAITPTPRWDPAEQPTLAGRVECASWADLRQRTGPVRVLTLTQASGERVQAWCSWQQLVALLDEAEAQHGRSLQRGDCIAIHAHGSQRVGRSRSPSRLFMTAIEWSADQ